MFDDLIFTASSVCPAEGAGLIVGGEVRPLRPEDVVAEEPTSDAGQGSDCKAATDEEKVREARRRKRARRRERFQGWRYEQHA
jgi:hypothetical protein